MPEEGLMHECGKGNAKENQENNAASCVMMMERVDSGVIFAVVSATRTSSENHV